MSLVGGRSTQQPNNNSDNADLHDDRNYAVLRSLCRGRPRSAAGRSQGGGSGEEQKVHELPPSSSSSLSAAVASAAATAAANGNHGGKNNNVAPDSVILLTRVGGERVKKTATASTKSGNGKGDGKVTVSDLETRSVASGLKGAQAAEVTTPAKSNAEEANAKAEGEAKADLRREREEAVTAARLVRLWTEEGGRLLGAGGGGGGKGHAGRRGEEAGEGRQEGEARGERRGARGRVILHACAGPGAFRAVREALAGGVPGVVCSLPSAEALRGRGSGPGAGDLAGVGDGQIEGVNATGGEDGEKEGEGLGCRIGECAVAALGSLREDGAYCVVELEMPRAAGGGGDGIGWSVASVDFGRIWVGAKGERNAGVLSSGERGNFVVNF